MKKMKAILVGIAALSMACFLIAIARGDEYLDLDVKGDEMAPTIRDGDTLRVKMFMNGSLIKTGTLTSANPGDIIVYCSMSAWDEPSSMWMCGRAISKHYDGKNWIIQTQLDSSTKPDDWEVPEYDLLGVVTEVVHNTNTTAQQSTSTNQQSGQSITNPEFTLPGLTPLVDFTEGIALGLALALVAKKMPSSASRTGSR